MPRRRFLGGLLLPGALAAAAAAAAAAGLVISLGGHRHPLPRPGPRRYPPGYRRPGGAG